MRLAAGLTGLGDAVLRPQPVRLLGDTDGSGVETLVRRVVSVGADVRVELELQDGRELWGQVSAAEAEMLELHEGQILNVSVPPALAPMARAA